VLDLVYDRAQFDNSPADDSTTHIDVYHAYADDGLGYTFAIWKNANSFWFRGIATATEVRAHLHHNYEEDV